MTLAQLEHILTAAYLGSINMAARKLCLCKYPHTIPKIVPQSLSFSYGTPDNS